MAGSVVRHVDQTLAPVNVVEPFVTIEVAKLGDGGDGRVGRREPADGLDQVIVVLAELDLHDFSVLRADLLTDEIRFDRKLAMTAIHHHRQLNRTHPPEVAQCVQRGANGTTGVENIIDENDVLIVDVGRNVRASYHRLKRDASEIIAVQINVEDSNRRFVLRRSGHRRSHALSHRDAASMNADGNFVVAWSNPGEADALGNIKGQRFFAPAPDANETNDSFGEATDLGTLTDQQTLAGLSLDSAGDIDFFRFRLPAAAQPGNTVTMDFLHAQGDLTLELIPQAASLQKGDLVLTSGLGGGYPPDLIVGQVVNVRARDFDLFQQATVQPVVDFNQLQIVLVIVNFKPVDIAPLEPAP